MDLQTRKLNLISYLAQIKDELFFNKLEKFIYEKKALEDIDFKPFTIDELVHRIEQSEEDIANGRFKSQEEVEKISKDW